MTPKYLILLGILLPCLLAQNVTTNTSTTSSQTSILSVTGTASASVNITTGTVTLLITSQAQRSQDALQGVSQTSQSVLQILQSNSQVSQIQTVSIQLLPIVFNGTTVSYTARYVLSFSSP